MEVSEISLHLTSPTILRSRNCVRHFCIAWNVLDIYQSHFKVCVRHCMLISMPFVVWLHDLPTNQSAFLLLRMRLLSRHFMPSTDSDSFGSEEEDQSDPSSQSPWRHAATTSALLLKLQTKTNKHWVLCCWWLYCFASCVNFAKTVCH